MPPRRYSNGITRELTPERELIGWGHYFEDGNDDYFPGLPQIGVVPTHALVKDAWSRLGALFLEAYWRPTKLSRVGPPQAVVRSKLHLGERAAFPTRRGYASALIQTNGAACWL